MEVADKLKHSGITVLNLTKQKSFITTPYIKEIAAKAIKYLKAGYPIHFQGPAGTGKTTLAMHIAAYFNLPVTIIYGNDEYKPSDMIGSESGYRREKVVDNFIHTVLKTVDDYQKKWVDNQLTVACRNGFILIYDEFTRSRPETNNILLSILEEKMLETSNTFNNSRYLKVHPDFKAIFTSNSQEYVGVHKIQDALLDRMITINMEYMDAETEREIVRAKGNVSYEDADRIVNIIREFRNNDKCTIKPSLRSGIMIGKIIRENGSHASKEDAFFRKVAFDVLASKIGAGVKSRDNEKSVKENEINELIEKYC